jgi:hypothetical protein
VLSYNIYSKSYKDEKTNDYIYKNIELFNENLEIEKKYALSLSKIISQNNILKNSLITNNQQKALVELKKITKSLENIDIQVHTKNLEAFARTWDKGNYKGKKLGLFRKGLVIVKKSKEPLVSIELGKRLNIKAISPMLDENNNFSGSIEVIVDFKNIKQRLKKFNISMMMLLDKEFINIAVDLKKHKIIERYYIIDDIYNQDLVNKLNKNSKILEKKELYNIVDNKILVILPMNSIGLKNIGIIILQMDGKNRQFNSSDNLLNIYYDNDTYIFNKNKKREVIIK